MLVFLSKINNELYFWRRFQTTCNCFRKFKHVNIIEGIWDCNILIVESTRKYFKMTKQFFMQSILSIINCFAILKYFLRWEGLRGGGRAALLSPTAPPPNWHCWTRGDHHNPSPMQCLWVYIVHKYIYIYIFIYIDVKIQPGWKKKLYND